MMSLLSVTVKKARYVGAQAAQFNTYVTLKLQNVKSTTVTVKGATPCWEQDFLFETNDLNTGLLIEVWSKGMIWDRAMGYHWIPLQTVQYSNEEGSGQWLSLEAELVMRDGEVVGTKNPTGHSLLVDCRFELPFDPENIEASDLQRKLEMLNNIMDQEARLEQARRQMQYFGHSGYSEDSDYTSDLNYPVGQHANSSASQFRAAAHQIHTPQRSLETSRENSYERDDAPGHQHHLPTPATHHHHLSPGSHRRHHQRCSPGMEEYSFVNAGHNTRQYPENNTDSDPLFYNSRPRNKPDYSSQETWVSCDNSFYNQSMDSVDVGFSVDSEYYGSQTTSRSKGSARRPSLERQSTLYDDSTFYGDPSYYGSEDVTQVNCVDISSQPFNQNQSCDEFFDSLSYPFQEERYGQDEEDRQWDSGGFPTISSTKSHSKKLPTIPAVQNYMNKRRSSAAALDEGYPCYEEPYRSTPTVRRRMPQLPAKRSSSRQSSLNDGFRTPDNCSHRGASLPPTPTKTPKMLPRIAAQAKTFNSLPPTPGRQLPKPNMNHRSAKARRNSLMKRTNSAEYSDNLGDYDNYYMRPGAVSAREMYNEDYNYAYQSIDNLPAQPEDLDVNQVQGYGDRTSAVMNNLNANKNGISQYQPQSIDDYYYGAQDEYQEPPHEFYDGGILANRRKLLGKSAMLQQNTDSLESRDDELKESFETAVSSINSSLHQLKRTGYPEYSTAGERVTNVTPTVIQPLDSLQNTVVSTTQYHRDQQLSPPKTIVSGSIPTTLPSVTVVQVHNQTPYTTNKAQNRGMLKQQDSIVDVTYLNQTPITNSYLQDQDSFHDANDSYLEPQESVESYIEEEPEDYNKAINHDSPSSVIHVDGYGDDQSLRRGSSQITVVDPYHPSVQRPNDPYVPMASRRSSTTDQYQRRTSGDAYQNAQDDPYMAPPSRKTSIVEPYQPRRASVRLSPTPPQHEEIPEEEHVPADDEVPEKKSVSFEEEEEAKQPRPQVTAQQRWLWAYNKIIMQLNNIEMPICRVFTLKLKPQALSHLPNLFLYRSLSTEDVIRKERKYVAHNYHCFPLALCKGEGVHVWDVEGRRYLDLLSGYGTNNFGHCHPRITAALEQQSKILQHTSRAFYNNVLGEYSEFITKLFGFDKILPSSTGVEAAETAVKMARKWGYKVKKIPENEAKVIFAEGNFWGRSIAAISASTNPAGYENYGPYVPGFSVVPFDDLCALEECLKDPWVCAFMIEPIQGEAGIVVPSDGYLRGIRDLCTTNNVLWIADEIQSGLGRAGRRLAVDYEKVKPDILCLGKALGGGAYPVSACLADDPVMLVIEPGTHGSTFGGNPLGCRVAMTALQVMEEEKLACNSCRMGEVFRKELNVKVNKDIVCDVRGKGLFNAMELTRGVADPWDVILKLREHGLITKNTHDTVIRLTPPLIINLEQTTEAVEIIVKTIDEIANSC